MHPSGLPDPQDNIDGGVADPRSRVGEHVLAVEHLGRGGVEARIEQQGKEAFHLLQMVAYLRGGRMNHVVGRIEQTTEVAHLPQAVNPLHHTEAGQLEGGTTDADNGQGLGEPVGRGEETGHAPRCVI